MSNKHVSWTFYFYFILLTLYWSYHVESWYWVWSSFLFICNDQLISSDITWHRIGSISSVDYSSWKMLKYLEMIAYISWINKKQNSHQSETEINKIKFVYMIILIFKQSAYARLKTYFHMMKGKRMTFLSIHLSFNYLNDNNGNQKIVLLYITDQR